MAASVLFAPAHQENGSSFVWTLSALCVGSFRLPRSLRPPCFLRARGVFSGKDVTTFSLQRALMLHTIGSSGRRVIDSGVLSVVWERSVARVC